MDTMARTIVADNMGSFSGMAAKAIETAVHAYTKRDHVFPIVYVLADGSVLVRHENRMECAHDYETGPDGFAVAVEPWTVAVR